eukprot:1374107-Alexandrium_andersonii.AAC.1
MLATCARKAVLACVGFVSPLACLPIAPVWSEEQWCRLRAKCMSMRKGYHPWMKRDLEEGSLSLKLVPLELGGRPPWRES